MEAIVAIFMASLAGSPHCAAMCGPFLAFAAGQGSSSRWTVTGWYHAGRVITYVLLGAVAGALGSGVERVGALAGVSRLAAIVAGTLMVLWGLDTILALRGFRSRLHAPPAMQRLLGRVTQRVRHMPASGRAFVTGLSTALLPCGWLYAFVAAAGATASPARAAFAMLVFWTGTLPIMAAMGIGLQRVAGPLRRSLPIVTAVVVVAIGLLTIAGRMQPSLERSSISHSHVQGH